MTGGEPDAVALAAALAGAGGEPARPGVVHYVGVVGADATVSARGAVVLASADRVLVPGPDPLPDAVAGLVRPGAIGPLPASPARPRDPLGTAAGIRRRRAATLRRLPVVGALVPRAVTGVDGAPHDRDRGRRNAAALADAVRAPGVVVRFVPATPSATVPGLVPELEALDAIGVPYRIDPAPAAGPGVPAVLTRWRDRLPLTGVTVLVPRAPHQASALVQAVRSRGGRPVVAPAIRTVAGDPAALDAAVHELRDGAFAALALTSPNGVDALAGALARLDGDARWLRVGLVAAVGPGTERALWEALHVRADLIPATATTAALGAAFPTGAGRVLLPRADLATSDLPDALRVRGWTPVEVVAYRTERPARLPAAATDLLAGGWVDVAAVLSASTARNLAALLPTGVARPPVVSIGPVTTAAGREVGLEVVAEADPHTLDGLLDALEAFAAGRDEDAPRRSARR